MAGGGRAPGAGRVNLHIGRGELVVLIGASGSGKSTLLKMINRMEQPTAGAVTLDGQDMAQLPVRDLRLRMGYVIQSVGLFPHWTVARNIGVVPTMLGWTAERIAERVSELLTLFDLDPATYGPRYPHQLSGGQQQRVGVARALAADPEVLLMDEPFGALDPLTRAALQDEVKRIHQASGKTIVMVTHDIDEALLLATRIVLLRARPHRSGRHAHGAAEPAGQRLCGGLFGPQRRGLKLLSLRSAGSLARAEAAQAVAQPARQRIAARSRLHPGLARLQHPQPAGRRGWPCRGAARGRPVSARGR